MSYSRSELLQILSEGLPDVADVFTETARNGKVICLLCCSSTESETHWRHHFRKEHKFDQDVPMQGFCFSCNKTVTSNLSNVSAQQAHYGGVKHLRTLTRTLQTAYCPTCGWIGERGVDHPHDVVPFAPLLRQEDWNSFVETQRHERQEGEAKTKEARNIGFINSDKKLQQETEAYIRTLVFIVGQGYRDGDRVSTKPMCIPHFEKQVNLGTCPVPSLRKALAGKVCFVCNNLNMITGGGIPRRDSFVYSVSVAEIKRAGRSVFFDIEGESTQPANEGGFFHSQEQKNTEPPVPAPRNGAKSRTSLQERISYKTKVDVPCEDTPDLAAGARAPSLKRDVDDVKEGPSPSEAGLISLMLKEQRDKIQKALLDEAPVQSAPRRDESLPEKAVTPPTVTDDEDIF